MIQLYFGSAVGGYLFLLRGCVDIARLNAFKVFTEDQMLDLMYCALRQLIAVRGARVRGLMLWIKSVNKRMRDKHLWTENDKGALVSLQEAYDENEEARL